MTAINLENPVATAMYEGASRARDAQGQRTYLGMSSIGDPCSRKIWYGFRGYTPSVLDGRIEMIFSLGSAVEAEVLKWLRQGGYQIEEQQSEYSALNDLFRGHCDGIIEGITQRKHILEIKSASASRFKAFQMGSIASVSPTYYAQVQCYMGYSGLDRAVWVVMNKNTCELYVERCHFEYEQFRRIELRARTIINNNHPPERLYPKEPGRECGMCEYRGHCWSSPYIQVTKTCGTCGHCWIEQCQPECQLHQHKIEKWGMACPDWQFRDLTDEVPF